ncbi:hypothetical protein SAMN05444339_102477 [Loktanella atrilutea]|uniref:Uncharacterized protein n=1 Tax=Loktanella atrilutea TaxID=366533 RepID=A0A1M4XH92_LOKAT|nr:hypothetical protein [Loktanella atrilutea]SHE92683.1 hypothetical protein SAMN05444339_102477 [Loktanella atrilutea]
MAISILGALIGLAAAIASVFVNGISVFESCAIYLVMSLTTVAMCAISASWPVAAEPRT